MTKHTSGPWIVVLSGNGCLDIITKRGPRIYIAQTYGEIAANEANARLLAAAPDLLNGCNALLDLLQIIAGRDDVPSDLAAMINPREGASINHRILEARDAIAKAKSPPSSATRTEAMGTSDVPEGRRT